MILFSMYGLIILYAKQSMLLFKWWKAGDEVENTPKISPKSLWCSSVAQDESRIKQRDKQLKASDAQSQPALEHAFEPELTL